MAFKCNSNGYECNGNHCQGCQSHMPRDETRNHCWQCRKWQRLIGSVAVLSGEPEDEAQKYKSYGT